MLITSSIFFCAHSIDLSLINDSDSTVLITFIRSPGSSLHGKLLEAGEVINFGRVYEASVQSYSTLWGYIAPAKHMFLSSTLSRHQTIDRITVRLKGITGRGLLTPFGEWDYEIILGKIAQDVNPRSYLVPTTGTVLDAFPTAKRKIMYTPRYILGLPQYAGIEDAVEAALMLEDKWNTIGNLYPEHQKLSLNASQIIEESRHAFEFDQADVPLHIPVQMRCSSDYIDPLQEIADTAWS
jgi:hypothetical protein